MLKIRLSRFGSKKRPTYRVTISEHLKDARGDVLEYLGHYNPRSNPKIIELKADRIKFWLGKGAQASPTVHNLLVSKGVIEDKKVRSWKPKKKEEKKEEVKPGAKAEGAEVKPAEKAEEVKPEEKKEEEKPAEPEAKPVE